MEILGRGRITIWEGGSLWAFDVPADRLRGNRAHAHHAIQFTLSCGGRFRFHAEAGTVEGPAVLIAPEVAHRYDPVGRNAIVFVEPESRAGAAILSRMAGRPIAALDAADFAGAVPPLTAIWDGPRPPDEEVAGTGRQVIAGLAGGAEGPRTLDPRIARTVAWIGGQIEGGVAVEAAAEVACLSEGRFSHLFAEEVGLPFRSYVLWRRLNHAVERMAAGSSLTGAAHEAGFADSAHFSRTFHRMFGVPAASLSLE
jgi:AraC-like DNA-binding protein